MALRVHLLHRHARETMVILEEGNPPHPRYPCCDILVPWVDLNGGHTTNAQCAKGAEQKRNWPVADEMREIMARALQAYIILLNLATSFKYLGRIMTPSDDDWPKVVRNLRKARKSLMQFLGNIGKGGGEPEVVGDFFKDGGAGGNYFWVGDMGDDPPHMTGTGGGSAQSIHTDY